MIATPSGRAFIGFVVNNRADYTGYETAPWYKKALRETYENRKRELRWRLTGRW